MLKSLFQSKKSLKFTESHLKSLENGKMRAYSKACALQVTHESTIEKLLNLHSVLLDLRLKKETSVIVECLPKSKVMTSKDSPNTLETYILSTLLLRILVQESILHEKGALLGSALEGNIGEVVAYKDRRFGFELIETIIKRAGGHVTVLNNQMYQSKRGTRSRPLVSSMYSTAVKWEKRRYNSSAQSQSEDIPNPNTETHS